MKRTLSLCCAAHFLVDFACAFLLFRALRGEPQWAELLIGYNFCAFAVQMPLGLLADRWDRDGPLGLFVSPGALGLFCGTLLGKGTALPLLLPPLVLLCAAAALFGMRQARPGSLPGAELPPLKTVCLPVLLLLAVVILRSFVGMSLSFPWKGEGNWAVALTVSLALGKAAGGYLADRFGPVKTAVLSLGLSAVLLLCAELPVCGVLAVFLFNMTMPLTLWACARLLPLARGFAFGILTFGLFLGFLPTAFGAGGLSAQGAALLALASLLSLLPGLGRAVKL